MTWYDNDDISRQTSMSAKAKTDFIKKKKARLKVT